MGNDWHDHCWKSREWRLNHLYWIEQKNGPPMRFRMNWAQQELFSHLWYRNNILKARQLGMSTITALLILDGCLFNSFWHAGIVDKSKEDAQEKLAKIKFAWESLASPPEGDDWVEEDDDRRLISEFARQVHLVSDASFSETRARFANGSHIRTGISLRGGTLQFLHVSEFGHVAANFPRKAVEVLSGALNTVSSNGIVIMESTHEGGKTGHNYRLTKRAMENVGKKLSPLDFKFFFFPWWRQPEYRVRSDDPLQLGDEMKDYFSSLAADGIVLDDDQKRWYAAQENTFGFFVRQEFPSSPGEAFESLVENAIYGKQLDALRAEGRLAASFEADDEFPLYVSWDIGMADFTALWLIQPRGNGKFYILDCHVCNNSPSAHYVGVVRRWEAEHGQSVKLHLLPHDADHSRDNVSSLTSYAESLRSQGLPCLVVPRTRDVWAGINQVRNGLRHCVFHTRCSLPVQANGREFLSGIHALESYQSLPAGFHGALRDAPLHNEASHAADAFRTFWEAVHLGFVDSLLPSSLFSSIKAGPRKGMAKGVPWA